MHRGFPHYYATLKSSLLLILVLPSKKLTFNVMFLVPGIYSNYTSSYTEKTISLKGTLKTQRDKSIASLDMELQIDTGSQNMNNKWIIGISSWGQCEGKFFIEWLCIILLGTHFITWSIFSSGYHIISLLSYWFVPPRPVFWLVPFPRPLPSAYL
jgi:hypothetical protein